ncbi:MAG TPA: hydroxymethylbilane synthase [Saprospiraceae bacterium]|nr:hydroxymethylbilane synthase [Saprospiraceae bacterium]
MSPLYEIGVQGIFTKTLDTALINHKIDIAVHSLKDVPTFVPSQLSLICIPPRANPSDTLVFKQLRPRLGQKYSIASSSLRRKSQWIYKYGNQQTIYDVRGNINTRLNKLNENDEWNGIIFATAGLDRIALEVPNRKELSWMIPAPAQGALGIMARNNDEAIKKLFEGLHSSKAEIEVHTERRLLRELEGGCTMPLGALVDSDSDTLYMNACLLDPTGTLRIDINREFKIKTWQKEISSVAAGIKDSEIFKEIKNLLIHER